MDATDSLAEQFESHRPQLRAVAHRMLGCAAQADDAVQEAWLRASRADTSSVENLGGWLTTIVARVCLNMLRSRDTRREEPMDSHVPEPITNQGREDEEDGATTDSVDAALHVVLATLTPAEQLAFVLHDVFGVPFDEIASIVGRSAIAVRQLASRARRQVHGTLNRHRDHDIRSTPGAVDAFLAAARGGEFDGLLDLLLASCQHRNSAPCVEARLRWIAMHPAQSRETRSNLKRLNGNQEAPRPVRYMLK